MASQPDVKTQIKVKMTANALRNRFINKRHAPSEAIVCCVATHNRGKASNLLDEMVTKNEAGWVQYGATDSYRIVDVDAAVEFVRDNGGDVPFGFD